MNMCRKLRVTHFLCCLQGIKVIYSGILLFMVIKESIKIIF